MALPSASVATTVVTAVRVSLTLTLTVAPPPLLVMTGASLTRVTVTEAVAVALLPPYGSIATKLIVRVVVLGWSEALSYWMVRSTCW